MRTITALTAIFLLFSPTLQAPAGSLDPGSAPAAGSGMPSTSAIYNRLDTGAAIGISGAFNESTTGAAAGFVKTLADIGGKLPAPDNGNGAMAGNVISGKTFWGLRTDGAWGPKSGTASAGASVTGAEGSLSVTIPPGLYQGTTAATFFDTRLTAANIKKGITIFGVTGTAITGARAKRVNKTGQTQCWDSSGTLLSSCAGTGQDGEYQYGITPAIVPDNFKGITGAYNTPALTSGTRFTDNGDGTVIDNLTALIWLKNANCFGVKTWADALTAAKTLSNNACGLNDGSVAGQWRLPNINELHSLGPDWLSGTPFVGVQDGVYDDYWSSTTSVLDATTKGYAYAVITRTSLLGLRDKMNNLYVWPVRGGQ